MAIRDYYAPTLDAIAHQYGEAPAAFHIGPDTPLQTLVGYTRRHVVDGDEPHFRYGYYRDALSLAFERLRFDPGDRQVVHLDIGCGSGVFSWVLYDHMTSHETLDPDHVDFYGYDHCGGMIDLAHLFLEHFPERYEFRGYSDLAEISIALAEEDFAACELVVTFGYALVQVRDDPAALRDFATLIRCAFPSHSCIIVAADAYSLTGRASFRYQCGELETALNSVGLVLENRFIPTRRSIMTARLATE